MMCLVSDGKMSAEFGYNPGYIYNKSNDVRMIVTFKVKFTYTCLINTLLMFTVFIKEKNTLISSFTTCGKILSHCY